MVIGGPCSSYQDKMDEADDPRSRWYFSRKEIEDNSPSRRDGIDLKKETYLRKSYCTFLQDLGMRLKVPQVTIATAIVFCHRFFLRQSQARNDRRTIATVCMFLAGKVEETPRPLKDVILVSYEINHKKDPSAIQKIKQKEVYEQQKELILLGERLVLATLGFDLNVHHPYKPLVEAIKKFKVAQNALAQVAWNFVNDGLRTSLCLQFEAHHIAAGAIFLAAKFLKVKLPSDGEKVWWQEFDVNPRQLEDVSNQMLELYEQNHMVQSSHANEGEGNTGGGGTNYPGMTASTVGENSISVTGPSQEISAVNVKHGEQVLPSSLSGCQSTQYHSNDNESGDTKSGVWDLNTEVEPISCGRENTTEALSCSKSSLESSNRDAVTNEKVSSGCSFRQDAITKIDKDKVKAALEKRKKLRNDGAKKTDIMDDEDLIERELESGIEMAIEDEKVKQERCYNWPKPLEQADNRGKRNLKVSEQKPYHGRMKSKTFDSEDGNISVHGFEENGEEGELSSLDEHESPSPKLQSKSATGWLDSSERDHKRPRVESHV